MPPTRTVKRTQLRPSPQKMTIEELAIKPGDRGLIVGMSGEGKSILAKQHLVQYRKSLWTPQRGYKRPRVAIFDTKPRWRATRAITGASLAKRYKGMAPGDRIESVVCSDLKDWRLVWDPDLNPYNTVIFQNRDMEDDALIAWQNECIRKLYDTQDFKQPTLAYVDEGMDFFGENGTSRGGGAIRRLYRNGREMNLSPLLGVQRPKQIQTQVITECNLLDLFFIKFEADIKRLGEMGVPLDMEIPPEKSHRFRHFRDGDLYPNMLRVGV